MTPRLILAAHGSRDPRFAVVANQIRDAVAARLSDVEVSLGYLDLNEPLVEDVLDGSDGAVVVPMLLSNAFHARVDLPQIIGRSGARQARQAAALGDARLIDAAADRLRAAGFGSGDAILSVAVGSSDGSANAAAVAHGCDLGSAMGTGVVRTVFATKLGANHAHLRNAVAALLRGGADRIVVSPYFIAAGLLSDRLERALDEFGAPYVVAGPLGAHPQLVNVVCDRYRAAVAVDRPADVWASTPCPTFPSRSQAAAAG